MTPKGRSQCHVTYLVWCAKITTKSWQDECHVVRLVYSANDYRLLPPASSLISRLLHHHHHHHHHHHIRLFETMTKRIVTLDKKVNESIGPFKKHTGNKIAVIIITRFSSKYQIMSTSSKVID